MRPFLAPRENRGLLLAAGAAVTLDRAVPQAAPPRCERAPGGGTRFVHPMRLTPWRPRVPARRVCASCCINLVRARTLAFSEPVVTEGRLIPGGFPLCGRHEVYLPEHCTCGQRLFVSYGLHHHAGALRESATYVNERGEVLRECPRCEAVLR